MKTLNMKETRSELIALMEQNAEVVLSFCRSEGVFALAESDDFSAISKGNVKAVYNDFIRTFDELPGGYAQMRSFA